MLTNLRTEAQRQQRPMAELSSLVANVTGNKSTTGEWFSGYAADPKPKSDMPAHLDRALETGLKLGKVSDEAFVTLRSIRD